MLRSHRFSSRLVSACALACLALGGCGGDVHPDTGYGADESVPSTVNCADLCRRSADCAGHLCAEDTGKDAYIDASAALKSQCLASCPSDALTSKITSTMWTCLFTSTCRQVFESDVCHVQATYHCQ